MLESSYRGAVTSDPFAEAIPFISAVAAVLVVPRDVTPVIVFGHPRCHQSRVIVRRHSRCTGICVTQAVIIGIPVCISLNFLACCGNRVDPFTEDEIVQCVLEFHSFLFLLTTQRFLHSSVAFTLATIGHAIGLVAFIQLGSNGWTGWVD